MTIVLWILWFEACARKFNDECLSDAQYQAVLNELPIVLKTFEMPFIYAVNKVRQLTINSKC